MIGHFVSQKASLIHDPIIYLVLYILQSLSGLAIHIFKSVTVFYKLCITDKVFIVHTSGKANRLWYDMTVLAAGQSSHSPLPSPPLSVHYFLLCLLQSKKPKQSKSTQSPCINFLLISSFQTSMSTPFLKTIYKVFLCIFPYAVFRSRDLAALL